MNNVNIVSGNSFDIIKKVKLYKEIFGESPWNEGFICNSCGLIFPKKFMGSCSCDNPDLIQFYDNLSLKKDLDLLSEKEKYQEQVADVLGEKVGFIWGWNSSLSLLNSDKLRLNESQYEELYNQIYSLYPDFDFSDFYYFAEVGVKSDYRGLDIAGELYRNNLEQLKERGEKFIVVRTTKKSDVPYKWFKDLGYIDVFNYNDEQDRVILVFKI